MGSRLHSAKKPWKKIVAIVAGVAVLAAAGVLIAKKNAKKTETTEVVNLDRVELGDVTVAITGSGAVEPKDRYEIIAMVSGDVMESPFEEGDLVQEGDLLYRFDTESINLSLQKQQLSMQQSEMNYQNAQKQAEKLVVTAPCNGVISGMDFKVGDDITQGAQVASINDSVILEVVLPFNESQISAINIGDTATVTSSVNMGIVSGTVIEKAAVPVAQSDGSKLYDVTISFTNPGAFMAGQTVGGAVGSMISPGSGTISYSASGMAKSEAEGTVTAIHYKNGDYVQKGQTILTISSDTISNNIKSSSISYQNAKLALQESQKQLENYNITSPISGTVITKNAKTGDTIDRSNSTQTLMVIADISALKFSLEIDELDVDKVSVGQKVAITCDALPNERFMGEISNLSVEGTATNGVTTYTAEILIPQPGSLRPSMNVDASVIVQSVQNVLRVPAADVTTIMGKSYVFVPQDSEAAKRAGAEAPQGEKAQGKKPQTEASQGKKPQAEAPQGEKTQGEQPQGGQGRPGGMRTPPAPEGFVAIPVTVGVTSDDYAEITSGLSEGDEVYSQSVTSTGGFSFGGMRGGMGGMPMGGMGGMPGGMRR